MSAIESSRADPVLRASVASTNDEAKFKAIRDASQAFEELLLRQMLREVHRSSLVPTLGQPTDAYTEIADDHFAKFFADSGGLGFGRAMADQLISQIKGAGLIGRAPNTVIRP